MMRECVPAFAARIKVKMDLVFDVESSLRSEEAKEKRDLKEAKAKAVRKQKEEEAVWRQKEITAAGASTAAGPTCGTGVESIERHAAQPAHRAYGRR